VIKLKKIDLKILLIICLIILFSHSNIPTVSELLDQLGYGENETSFEKAIVVDVVDGDTIKVNLDGKEETVRLLLIDTPESVKPNTPVQPFGKEASDFMKKTLIKSNVVQIEKGNPERDKYGRLLAYVWFDGENINKKLISKGYARVAYVYPPNTKYLEEFRQEEKKAKEKKIGIWSIENYVREDGFNY
jgi:micrococcal nuclease